MAFFKSALNRVQSIFKRDEAPTRELAQDGTATKPDRKGWQPKLKRYWSPRIELELKNWASAVAVAEDPIRPRRELLYRLYHTVMEDAVLLSQVRTARFTVQLSGFVLERDGKTIEDKKLRALFERPWFNEYLEKAVDTELYGHTLLEFNPEMKDGEFQRIWLVPREHVRPESGELVLYVHDEKGLDYRDPKMIGKYLVELGWPDDLGLLKSLSRLVIRKEYAVGDWGRRNEKYGMPFLIVKTSTRDEKELDKKQEMLSNMGSNGWAILDDLDDFKMEESNQAFAYGTFKDMRDGCDSDISKLVNGQTGTSDEKSYVGSAQVHERILNDYTKARLRRIEYSINYCLMPFLLQHGYPIEGITYKFKDLLEKEPAKPGTMDTPMEDVDEQPGAAGQKKKPIRHRREALTLAYAGAVGDDCCGTAHPLTLSPSHPLTLSLDLEEVMQTALRNVWSKKVKEGSLDPASWGYFTESLWGAAQDGVGKSFLDTAYADPSYELLARYRSSIHTFAAFKNHSNIKELVAELLDPATGKPRSFSEFKKATAGLMGNYYEEWQQAEWQQAHSSARAGERWQQHEQVKHLFPYLRYDTVGDARVRKSHQVLDGVVKHIDDPFWDTYAPPNGWRCRCVTTSVSGPEVPPSLYPSIKEVPPMFRTNFGKDQELLPQSHPYFQGIPEPQRARLLKATSQLVYDSYPAKDWVREAFDDKTGGYVVRHASQAGERELPANLATAKRLMEMGHAVELVENRNGEVSPDALVDGRVWEMKVTSGSANSVQFLLRTGKAQAGRVLLVVPKSATIANIIKGMMSAVNMDKDRKLVSIGLLFEPNDLVELTAEQVRKRDFALLDKYQ